MPSTAESSPSSAARSRMASRIGISDSAALETEPLLAQVLGAEELLERLGAVQLLEDVPLVVDGQLGVGALDLLLDPALLGRFLDVHVLDADGAAVGVAQDVQDLAEGHPADPADHGVDADLTAGEELPVEVPDGEAVGRRVELGVHLRWLGGQRIEVGDQVTPHAMHVDERRHLHLLDDLRGLLASGVDVLAPPHRLVGHADGPEDVCVEVVGRRAGTGGPA